MFEAIHERSRGTSAAHPGHPGEGQGATEKFDLQRAVGEARVVFSGAANGTEIIDVYQKFPMAVAFPNVDDRRRKEAVLINTSGGVAGGDEIRIEVVAQGNASVAVTTQAAEKVYRALDRPARIRTRLRAEGNARLAWLPQETIVFNQARIARQTEIDVSSGTELIALEWLVLGRHRERRGGSCRTYPGQLARQGRRPSGMGRWLPRLRPGAPAASEDGAALELEGDRDKIYFGPGLEARLERLREIGASLECACGVTIVGAIIVVRVAAIASVDLRRGLRRFLDQLDHELGSGPFGVPKMWSC